MPDDNADEDQTRRLTLEAFADTIIPGERRHPGDHAVAGAAPGGGAVAAGAVELIEHPAIGIAGALDSLVAALNAHAEAYATEHRLALDASRPSFVALPFAERTELVRTLVGPEHPEREMWVPLAMLSTMAFDAGAHRSTAEALAAGHPGLRHIGFIPPEPDGRWRFPDFSYRRPLAALHPHTTPSGSPA